MNWKKIGLIKKTSFWMITIGVTLLCFTLCTCRGITNMAENIEPGKHITNKVWDINLINRPELKPYMKGKIIFSWSNKNDEDQIFLIDLDKMEWKLIGKPSISEWGYGLSSFSPDGSKIAYFPEPYTLSIMDTDGKEISSIKYEVSNIDKQFEIEKKYRGAYIRCPMWSPDGHRIAFAGCDSVLCIFDEETGNIKRPFISYYAGHFYNSEPDKRYFWFPDGNRLLYSGECGLGAEYFAIMIDLENQGQKVLFSGYFPALSPDGEKIIFWEMDRREPAIYYVKQKKIEKLDLGLKDDFPKHPYYPGGFYLGYVQFAMFTWSPDSKCVIYHTMQPPSYDKDYFSEGKSPYLYVLETKKVYPFPIPKRPVYSWGR